MPKAWKEIVTGKPATDSLIQTLKDNASSPAKNSRTNLHLYNFQIKYFSVTN